jgi:hypothetical protein
VSSWSARAVGDALAPPRLLDNLRSYLAVAARVRAAGAREELRIVEVGALERRQHGAEVRAGPRARGLLPAQQGASGPLRREAGNRQASPPHGRELGGEQQRFHPMHLALRRAVEPGLEPVQRRLVGASQRAPFGDGGASEGERDAARARERRGPGAGAGAAGQAAGSGMAAVMSIL